jgi:hypothetical protein
MRRRITKPPPTRANPIATAPTESIPVSGSVPWEDAVEVAELAVAGVVLVAGPDPEAEVDVVVPEAGVLEEVWSATTTTVPCMNGWTVQK